MSLPLLSSWWLTSSPQRERRRLLVDAELSPLGELERTTFKDAQTFEPLSVLGLPSEDKSTEPIKNYRSIRDSRDGVGLSLGQLDRYREALHKDSHFRMTQNGLKQVDAVQRTLSLQTP